MQRKQVINLLVTLVLLALIYFQISGNTSFDSVKSELIDLITSRPTWLISIVVLLMPCNWWMESLKWKMLVKQIQPYTMGQSWISILIGNALGIVTPARLGEYAGRLAGVYRKNRPRAITLNFVNSVSQNTVNVVVGILGTFIFLKIRGTIESGTYYIYLMSALLLVILIVVVYFNIPTIFKMLGKIPWPGKLKGWIDQILLTQGVPNNLMLRLLLLSLIRYTIFSTQYLIVLKWVGLDLGVMKMYAGIAMIYLVQSGIPLPPLSGLLARGQIAILAWSGYDVSMPLVLVATFVLWFINLIIPALVGVTLILLNRYSSNTYSHED